MRSVHRFEDAKEWYDSPAYREAHGGADYRAVFVDGLCREQVLSFGQGLAQRAVRFTGSLMGGRGPTARSSLLPGRKVNLG